MAIIGQSNYVVSAAVGIHGHSLNTIKCLLYTGAELYIVAKSFFPEHWTAHWKATGNVQLCCASKDSMGAIWKANLRVRIGHFLTQAAFHCICKLAVGVFFGNSFINGNILRIFLKWKKVTLYISKSVSVLAHKTLSSDDDVCTGSASKATRVEVTATKNELRCVLPSKYGWKQKTSK